MDYKTPEPRQKTALEFSLIALVFAAHALALFYLYTRVESDVFRFALPTFVAFFLYLFVAPKMKFWLVAALTFFSFWAGMFAAVNTYGS
ncbi:MAG TPA: hypothetical protein VG269_06450 [Tepidisphaeraceae bacterium]|nr:hypothetical protein [Tepidisphaeraceae bacterium]